MSKDSTTNASVDELLDVRLEIEEITRELVNRDREDRVADHYAASEKILALIQQREAEIHRSYGGCRNCYGKGYATKQSFVTGGGKKWATSPIKYCDCDRGRQLEALSTKEEEKYERGT